MILLNPKLFKKHNFVVIVKTHELNKLMAYLDICIEENATEHLVNAAYNIKTQIDKCIDDGCSSVSRINFMPLDCDYFLTLNVTEDDAILLKDDAATVKQHLRNKAKAIEHGQYYLVDPAQLHFYRQLVEFLSILIEFQLEQPSYEFKSKSTVHRLLQEVASLKKTKQQRPKVYKLIKAKHRRPFSLRSGF